MEPEVRFKYGSWESFNRIPDTEKDDSILYFLSNHLLYKGNMLVSNVQTIDGTFPETPDEDMRLNYYINLKDADIRYVTEDLKYIKLSQILLNDIKINVENLQKFVDQLEFKEILMPTLVVNGLTLVWTASNIESATVATKKLN